VKVALEIEITGEGSVFEVVGSRHGKEYARGRSTESIPQAFDLAIASIMTARGVDAYLVLQMLTGLRKIIPATAGKENN